MSDNDLPGALRISIKCERGVCGDLGWSQSGPGQGQLNVRDVRRKQQQVRGWMGYCAQKNGSPCPPTCQAYQFANTEATKIVTLLSDPQLDGSQTSPMIDSPTDENFLPADTSSI